MGRTIATAIISGVNATKEYSFLVDTGAYLGLPIEEIRDLGLAIVPNGRRRFLTADGIVEKDTYQATGRLGDQGFATIVVETAVPVIGYFLVEDLRLKVNPGTGELEPDPGPWLEPGYMMPA